mmetsp:Transcript_62247/g.181829  ORF Transcript_62247/g.181829 Transcript_62247/m.181829 type:complete len:1259 (+) Transcript_62247:40-3816(+)
MATTKSSSLQSDSYGWLSRAFFTWVHQPLSRAKAGSLGQDDYLRMPQGCNCASQLEAFWAVHCPGTSAAKTIWKILRLDLMKAFAMSCLSSIIKIGSVVLVRAFTQKLLDEEEDSTPLWAYAGGLVVLAGLEAIILPQANLLMSICTLKLANVFSAVVYQKSKTFHPFVKNKYKRGELVNLALNDCSRIVDSAVFLVVGVSAPVLLLFSLLTAVVIIGPSALLIVFWTCIITAAVNYMGKKQGVHIKAKLAAQGQRLSVINEMLQSIRVVKLSAWEEFFEDKICGIRSQEERSLLVMRTFLAATNPTCIALTPISCLSTIVLYTTIHGTMPPIPDTIALINILRNISVPLTLLGVVIGVVFSLAGNLKRLNEAVSELEFDRARATSSLGPQEALDIKVSNGTFAWTQDASALKSINMSVPRGQLVFIVGHLGQGKSSLLQAIIGQMESVDATHRALRCAADGSSLTALAPQQPVVMNMTLRDNVTFKRPFEEARFQNAVDAAALGPDLELLPAGDMTEIGEKGVTLSGGQRARVGLARVAYAQPEVALLDDPFAALDMEVGRHVFEHLVCGALDGATRLVVSSQVHLLHDQRVDRIILVSEGRIVEDGTYEELCQSGTELHRFLQSAPSATHPKKQEELTGPTKVKSFKQPLRTAGVAAGRVTTDERKEEGSIKLSSLWKYLRVIGLRRVCCSLLLIWLYNWGEYAPDLWLSVWQEDLLQKPDEFYLAWWIGVMCLGLGIMYTSRINGAFVTGRAATSIHNDVLSSILQCTMTFFEQTPSGRIMNRFGQDQFILDLELGIKLEATWMIIFKCINTCVVIAVSVPWVAIALVALVPPIWMLARYLRPSMRDAQRFGLLSKSLPFNCMEETLTGLAVIQAAGVETQFTTHFHSAVDKSMAWAYTKAAITCWGEQQVMFLSAAVVGMSAGILVLMRGAVVPAIASVGLIYIVIMADTARFMFTIGTQAEASLASVERSEEFINAPHEAPRSLAGDIAAITPKAISGAEVVFQDVVVRYQPNLAPALNSISFSVAAGERVGIVGRTGSGKSTLLVTLVRIVEPCSGKITVGPYDVLSLGLRFLRTLITVIPQEPVMFSGSLQWNLDPEGSCSIEALEGACRSSGLFQVRPDLGLSATVTEGGANFSVGERQLLCMARALLRRNPVMLFDEATANIDVENDARLQRVLREEFRGATILTVAHRLHTIIDSDRIMMLSGGRVAEFDEPSMLLGQNGAFASLAKEAGLGTQEVGGAGLDDTHFSL